MNNNVKEKWKYKVLDLTDYIVEDELNKLGKKGWELVNLAYQGLHPLVVLKKKYWG